MEMGVQQFIDDIDRIIIIPFWTQGVRGNIEMKLEHWPYGDQIRFGFEYTKFDQFKLALVTFVD